MQWRQRHRRYRRGSLVASGTLFDEDDIDIGKPIPCQVMVCGVELTDEEKAEARQRAIRQYQDEELRKMQQRKSKSAAKPQEAKQTEPNLFGF